MTHDIECIQLEGHSREELKKLCVKPEFDHGCHVNKVKR
jgi:hypothetical protein